MKRIAAATALLSLALLVPTSGTTHAAPDQITPVRTPRTGATTTWSVGPKVHPYESWPDATTTANGWVVLAHSSADRHVPRKIDRRTVIRLSKDKGRTFRIVKVFKSEHMSGMEGIYRLKSGRIVLMLSDLNGHDDFNYIRTWKSDDNGQTWQPLSNRYRWTDPWSFGNLTWVTCGGGKLIIPWNSPGGWGMATSKDNGKHWKRTYLKSKYKLIEGRLVQVSGDKLIMFGRNNGGPKLFKSKDCGQSWFSQDLNMDGRLSEGAIKHGDLWRLVTINRETRRMEVRDARLTDLWVDGNAWSKPKYLRTLRSGLSQVDLGYPTVISVSRTQDLVLWYGNTKTPGQPMIYGTHLPWRG